MHIQVSFLKNHALKMYCCPKLICEILSISQKKLIQCSYVYTSPSLHDHWIAMNALQAIKSFYRQICFHQNQDSPFWGLHRAKQHLNCFMSTLKLTSNSCYIAAAATQGMLSCFPLQGVSAGKAWAERDFLFKSKWRYKSGTATVMRSSHTSLGLLRN